MKRRTFLKSAAAASAVPFMLRGVPTRAAMPLKLLAQLPSVQDSNKILIICQLFGGNDGINTLPPINDPNYATLRPNIACLAKTSWTNNTIPNTFFNTGLSGSGKSGDKGGFTSMMLNGTLAAVQNIGYPNPNLSHFRSTDIWLSGINDSLANDLLDTGWVGRYLSAKYPTFPADLPTDPLAIQFGGFSLALEAKVGRMGIEVNNPSKQQGVTSANDALDDNSTGTDYYNEYQFIADIANRSDKYATRVQQAYASGVKMLSGVYQNDGFGNQLANTAALIAGGLQTQVYVVSLGGFDTHVSQAYQGDGNTGYHPALLSMLSDAIAQFQYDMVKLGFGDRVIGLTVSEFGRRAEENGSFGTDHGASSVQFVFGTQVNSGIFGTPFDLANLDESGNLQFQIDYREMYLDVLMNWFGLSLTDARSTLKTGLSQEADGEVDLLGPLGVIRTQKNAVQQQMTEQPFAITSNYPNPFSNRTTVVLYTPKDMLVSLEVTNVTGERVGDVFSQTLAAGEHQIPLTLDVASGFYMVTARSVLGVATAMIQCVR